MTVLVTGANGFVGQTLCARLCGSEFAVRGAVRLVGRVRQDFETIGVGDISLDTDWSAALRNVQQVVHLAARVHVMHDRGAGSWAEFHRVNVEGTANLARQAATGGVKRFIYLSSIKVNGEFTTPGRPFTAADVPAPDDSYGVSKHKAEQLLRQIAADSGMEAVIIRPPLVYGPGVKANFESMMRWLVHGIPLPLAAVNDNRRSLVALDNLVDLIVTCIKHPAAVGQTFLVSDGEDLSTAALLNRMGQALGAPARLFYTPVAVLKLGAAMFGRQRIYQRLCGSLQVDISKTYEILRWTPPVSVDDGLRRAALGIRA